MSQRNKSLKVNIECQLIIIADITIYQPANKSTRTWRVAGLNVHPWSVGASIILFTVVIYVGLAVSTSVVSVC